MTTYTTPSPKAKRVARIILWAGVALLGIIALFSTLTVVPAGSAGVVTTFGKVSQGALTEGLHVKIPFAQQVHVLSTQVQKAEVEAKAASSDTQEVTAKIAVNFRIGNKDAARIYQTIGIDYSAVVLLPIVQDSFKTMTATKTAEDLIAERADLSLKTKELLQERVTEYGIVIEQFNIVNFDFSAEFNAAIEAKQVAAQNLMKTRTEQEQQKIIAETEAQKKKVAAEAEAKAIEVKAIAQAEANRKLAESLSEFLIEYEKIQKWNGELPVVSGGTAIVDIGDLGQE